MAFAAVMSRPPFRIYDRPLPDLDDAVASRKSGVLAGPNQVEVSPLITMVVYVVRDLAKQDAFRHQDAPRFAHKGRIGVRERISVLL